MEEFLKDLTRFTTENGISFEFRDMSDDITLLTFTKDYEVFGLGVTKEAFDDCNIENGTLAYYIINEVKKNLLRVRGI